EGLIREAAADPLVIKTLMSSAADGLGCAAQDIEKQPVRCFALAYDAVYDACCAYMRSQGYRTMAASDHASVLAFCRLLLPENDVRILRIFEAAEKRRHREMYNGKYSIGPAEAAELVARARNLIERLR
ncbi:MAG: hypothetical protein PHU70_10705, partial [Dehalococcoidia bacterium]|nr:hypothetical protein [Dehalococcoidia bacterium]